VDSLLGLDKEFPSTVFLWKIRFFSWTNTTPRTGDSIYHGSLSEWQRGK